MKISIYAVSIDIFTHVLGNLSGQASSMGLDVPVGLDEEGPRVVVDRGREFAQLHPDLPAAPRKTSEVGQTTRVE